MRIRPSWRFEKHLRMTSDFLSHETACRSWQNASLGRFGCGGLVAMLFEYQIREAWLIFVKPEACSQLKMHSTRIVIIEYHKKIKIGTKIKLVDGHRNPCSLVIILNYDVCSSSRRPLASGNPSQHWCRAATGTTPVIKSTHSNK